jgi:hypothetical protein
MDVSIHDTRQHIMQCYCAIMSIYGHSTALSLAGKPGENDNISRLASVFKLRMLFI